MLKIAFVFIGSLLMGNAIFVTDNPIKKESVYMQQLIEAEFEGIVSNKEKNASGTHSVEFMDYIIENTAENSTPIETIFDIMKSDFPEKAERFFASMDDNTLQFYLVVSTECGVMYSYDAGAQYHIPCTRAGYYMANAAIYNSNGFCSREYSQTFADDPGNHGAYGSVGPPFCVDASVAVSW